MDNRDTEIQQPDMNAEKIVGAVPGEQAAPQKPVYAQSSDELLVIPRVVFNYGVIAVSFFILGIIIGGVAGSRLGDANSAENRQLIADAVAAALGGSAAPQRTGPDPNVRYEVSADDDPALGPEDAPITIIEFADYKCAFCARFFRETLNPLLDAYDGQIRIVFRDYPILGDTSFDAAYAAECAHAQDAFWPYHDLLYENQQVLGRDAFIAFAEELDLDVDAFTTCFDDQTYRDEVFADFDDGQRLGVSGTPTFYINGRPVIGAQPYAIFATAIDEELAAAAQSHPSESTPEATDEFQG